MKPYENFSEAWHGFLTELDDVLKEPLEAIQQTEINFACLGGFVMEYYGSTRTTQDLDFYMSKPYFQGWRDGSKRSELGKKHGVWLQSACFNVPEGYDTRMTEMFPNRFKHIRLLALDPYDLILSKLHRNSDKDRQDVMFLFRSHNLKIQTIIERYRQLPDISSKTNSAFRLWLEMFNHSRNPKAQT